MTAFSACNISIVGAIGGLCQADGSIIYRIIVNYQDAPGELDVNGTIYPVPVGSSASQKQLYLWMPGDGNTYDIVAQFVDEPNCKFIARNLITTSCCIPDFTSCDDNNSATINDVYIDCNCEGTCANLGNSCNDSDNSTYNDTYNSNCECEGLPCPSAGTTCNDLNPATTNDVEDGNCNCSGTIPCPSAGTACNDLNPATTNDVEDGNCNCAGTIPCPAAGTACNDLNPATTNDVEDGNCNCVGTIPCPAAGTACNDLNPATTNDVEDGNCNCAGTIPCPSAGTACNDGNPNTTNDVEDGNCNCAGTLLQIGDYTISVRAFLEGYMLGSKMHHDLETINLIPNNQPYNSSELNYNGAEARLLPIPADVVDWVIIGILDTDGNLVAQKAALLTENGLVYNPVTSGIPLTFTNVNTTNSYHVAIFHRSHLALVSAPIAQNGYVDFSQPGTALGNLPTKTINGRETMYAGDLNQDGIINNLDYNIWQLDNALVQQYVEQDIDGNGVVNNLDYNLWDFNKSKVGNLLIQF